MSQILRQGIKAKLRSGVNKILFPSEPLSKEDQQSMEYWEIQLPSPIKRNQIYGVEINFLEGAYKRRNYEPSVYEAWLNEQEQIILAHLDSQSKG